VLKVANAKADYCYEEALEAQQRASSALNPVEREFYLDTQAQWLRLGASFEHTERLKAFLAYLRSLPRKPFCPVCDLCMDAQGLTCRPDGLIECHFACACGTTRTLVPVDEPG
jgi:hypothetical protein